MTSEHASGDAAAAAAASRERTVQEGVEHLQRAAHETIAAMRALLDLAEDLVDDPKTGQHLLAGLSSLAEAGVRSGLDLTRKRRSPQQGTANDAGDGVQRIPVS